MSIATTVHDLVAHLGLGAKEITLIVLMVAAIGVFYFETEKRIFILESRLESEISLMRNVHDLQLKMLTTCSLTRAGS
jgi:hypothetical protein